jgi:predicted transcriptional regulator of viral defense system
MKFYQLVELFGEQGTFDLPSLRLLSSDEKKPLSMNLMRWQKQGKILALRRGLYALADPYRKTSLHGPLVSNLLYNPSYISEIWALSWFGVIPEKAELYTAVSVRTTRSFKNSYGCFRYRHLKTDLFFGNRSEIILQGSVIIAEPEKALLDLWYLEKGEWPPERMESMRIDPDPVRKDVLARYAGRFSSPRVERAVKAFFSYAGAAREGTVEL